MIKVRRFCLNPLEENCYILWDEATLEAAIVDCGAWKKQEEDQIASFIRDEKLTLKMVLQTHTHFDHIFGIPFLFSTYGLRPRFHAADESVYYAMPEMAAQFGISIPEPLPRPDSYLTDGETISIGTTSIQVLHTPGHSPGGVCFYIESEHLLLSGDTLFQGSMGRTDLPGGNMQQEIQSLRQKLMVLPPETIVLPGHGPSTTIGNEARYNPYI